MEKDKFLKALFDKIAAMKKRSAEILGDAKISGKLHYYFDPIRCNANEIIKLENGVKTIVKK